MKTRTIKVSRWVPHTIDGKTSMVEDRRKIQVPAPPRDLDRLVLNAVTTAAGLVLVACVVWSTATIGNLLTRSVPAGAAYTAASVFDLAWISCMALEWLARYDRKRAQLPMIGGYVALAIAMAAIALHGHLAGSLGIGIVSAAVCLLAKGLWTLLLAHYATPLDDLTQQWVDQQRAETGGRLAMVAVRRELQRAEGQIAAERAALQASPDADPDQSGQSTDDPDADIVPLVQGTVTTKDAVRTAWDSGLREEDAIRRCVSKALGRPISPDTVARYVRALKVGA